MTPTEHRLRLLLITDPLATHRDLAGDVERAVKGGVTALMVRAPGLPAEELLAMTLELKSPVKDGGALLLVNDRTEVAVAAGADGVHLKSVSIPIAEARKQLGEDRLIGKSTHEPEEVDRAFADGADYVVFGPVFDTPKKHGVLEPRGVALYHEVAGSAPGPVLALGGIDRHSIESLTDGPLPGVALIRGILSADDPEAAARALRAALARAER